MASQRRLFGDTSSRVGSSEKVESNSTRAFRMLKRYGECRSRDKGVPRACDCSGAISVHTLHDPTTRGMQFLRCPYEISDGRGEGCGFTRPWNQAILDEFDKIREDNADLRKALDAANEQIEELDNRVSAIEDNGSLEQAVIEANGKVDAMIEKFEELAAKYEKLDKYL